MELAELVAARPVPCAGLLLTLTQRCPMSCAHCSSSATMGGAQPPVAGLRRFVGSFDRRRPDIMLMTGGEPMLRPELVAELAESARRAGTRSAVLTGAFFARDGRLPQRILRAVRAVDHVSVSIDAFHEREVPRESVFRLLRRLLDLGVPASVHASGAGSDDPYLAGLVAAVGRAFADRVPMLVNTVRPIGRAAAWAAPARTAGDDRRVLPCSMAAWPVVAGDGAVVACCNQNTVDGRPIPEHLRLGHITVDDWATVRQRALESPVLRMLRATGPRYLWGADGSGYCDSCRRLGERPEALAAARRIATGVTGELLDRHATQVQVEAGPVAYLRRHASARYADLIASPAGGPRRRQEVT